MFFLPINEVTGSILSPKLAIDWPASMLSWHVTTVCVIGRAETVPHTRSASVLQKIPSKHRNLISILFVTLSTHSGIHTRPWLNANRYWLCGWFEHADSDIDREASGGRPALSQAPAPLVGCTSVWLDMIFCLTQRLLHDKTTYHTPDVTLPDMSGLQGASVERLHWTGTADYIFLSIEIGCVWNEV